jgi:hypothetical protein
VHLLPAAAVSTAQMQTPSLRRVFGEKGPGDDLLSHATAHYHRRGCVSLPSSGWDRVVPQRYVHQGEGGGSRIPDGIDRAHALMGLGRSECLANVDVSSSPRPLEVIWSSHTDH